MKDPRGLRGGAAAEQQAKALKEASQAYKPYARLFATDDGKEVLKDLEEQYLRQSMRGELAHDVHYKAGQHDVVLAILKKIDLGNREEVTDE